MHEYSIVQALLNQCEDIAKEHNSTEVEKIVCKIGVMSGIELHLFEIAFHTFKEGTLCSNAELIINEQKLKLHCQNCKREFEVEEVIYSCDRCGALCETIDGEDMYLMSLELKA
jgi:hydrogenase nickel insertion protein HypA